jgi:hypothetical protein
MRRYKPEKLPCAVCGADVDTTDVRVYTCPDCFWPICTFVHTRKELQTHRDFHELEKLGGDYVSI